ncbi:MAG: LppX_LprAFG lipoprotein [Chloroflexi bacterium]|nr:LppX_LprAFG lipoprotein [Chloroflexota bacterium]MDA1239847.1 LppX_LprAFG lipoprotein [Chloroflexota bacterium]MQC47869.1 LppX_LprAFG lipoprotein [Chloroflexota bacterium]
MSGAHRIALVALGVVALLLVACGGGGSVAGVDAEAVLAGAAERMDRVEAFHFVLTQENGTTPIMLGLELVSAEGDIAGTDRAQMEIRARLGTSNLRLGIVILPEQSYITNPLTGRWQREEVSLAAFFNPEAGVTALMRSVTAASVSRTERIGDVETYRVDATVDSGSLDLFAPDAPAGRALHARAWVGIEDSLVYRIEIEGAVTPEEAENTLRRLDLTRFDQPVEIVAPR